MDDGHRTDSEQRALWNGVAGQRWVESQVLLDGIFKPLETLLVDAVAAGPARRVLDVGCGTGGVTLAAARALGADGRAVGVDISEPMIAAAKDRARADGASAPASFLRADAGTHAFEPASFDMMISRFGVMFFDDFVRAFSNLRRAAMDDAELRFIAWRNPEENPFMTTAERAAAPLLPGLPARQPNAPGQFALADADRVRGILEESGWTGIEIDATDAVCSFPERELIHYFTHLGPVGRVFHEVEERTRAKIVETVLPAFDPFVLDAEVRFAAACWTVVARAPAAPKEVGTAV